MTTKFLLFFLLIIFIFLLSVFGIFWLNRESRITNETYLNLSEIVLNSSLYEGKNLTTVGELHYIVTIPEIRMPFNAVLTSGKFQIGILTSTKVKEGARVLVKGKLVKGYVERLGTNGWVKDKEVYYIIATEVKEL